MWNFTSLLVSLSFPPYLLHSNQFFPCTAAPRLLLFCSSAILAFLPTSLQSLIMFYFKSCPLLCTQGMEKQRSNIQRSPASTVNVKPYPMASYVTHWREYWWRHVVLLAILNPPQMGCILSSFLEKSCRFFWNLWDIFSTKTSPDHDTHLLKTQTSGRKFSDKNEDRREETSLTL